MYADMDNEENGVYIPHVLFIKYIKIINEQNQIGWFNFLTGIITQQFGIVQQEYYNKIKNR